MSRRSSGGGNSRPVYSTASGRLCPDCGRPVAECGCKAAAPVSAGDGIVRVRRESKGRGGKQVTVITGVPVPPSELGAVARQLKARCGSGGTAKNGVIEIQGDHRATVVELLRVRGWTVKLAGG